jgi:hypothetical protein
LLGVVCLLFTQPTLAFDPLAFTKFLGLRLGKSTLADVQRSLGTTPIVSTGEGPEVTDSIFLVTPDGSVVVDFWSGEMGGDQKTLLGFTVHKSDHFKMKKGKTFRLAKPLDDNLVQGIQFGMTQNSFDNIFAGGVQSAETFDTPAIAKMSQFSEISIVGEASYFDKESNQSAVYDEDIRIIAKFDAGGLYSLNVSRIRQ